MLSHNSQVSIGLSTSRCLPFFAAAFLTPAANGKSGYATFTAPVSAPNGFVVTYDASLVGMSSPPADGISCYLHGMVPVTPTGGYVTPRSVICLVRLSFYTCTFLDGSLLVCSSISTWWDTYSGGGANTYSFDVRQKSQWHAI
jgi:hypothetical protein